ncbi:hypothetical protein SISSUDRAFT_1035863 [Sistotremastrum suecicum HHB10207 ss-3]|uniref:Wax synthase domain-containing protein n=1 Tax=Sistotremastrum suecicum HHB10207 ss-3 TaxID=1314776 RepID=A0A166A7G3_9AGAM|nr:hypothetical protein SISSUDRAFT_1035863 [Sistotremastrum suecicum HHB10207 ss-3]
MSRPDYAVHFHGLPKSYLGFTLLFVSAATLPSKSPYAPFIRVFLTPPALYFFYDFGYGSYESPTHSVSLGLATVCLYGCMRVIETSLVGLWDVAPPFWIKDGVPQLLPDTTRGYMAYAFDLCTNLRGSSWFSGTHWDFIPPQFINPPQDRRTFLISNFKWLLQQYLILDLIDTMDKARPWQTWAYQQTGDPLALQYPITSLPVLTQIPLAISVCTCTFLAITFPFTIFSLIAVSLGGDPGGWPPMFDRPFHSHSLSDFWSNRWHFIFRRVFHRLSFIPVSFMASRTSATFASIVKKLVTFFLSALLHVLIIHRLQFSPHPYNPSHLFFDRSILLFFLSQPIALIAEYAVVKPLARAFGGRYHALIVRSWTWIALLWTGRYWSDVWIARGLWLPQERIVGVSLIRGLAYGAWFP